MTDTDKPRRTPFARHIMSRLITACVLLSSATASGSPAIPKKSAPGHTVFVLTFEPGADLFAAFGHTALVVERPGTGPRKVYNFGTYDFDAPDAKLRYAAGDLTYRLSVSTYKSTLERYRHFGRGGTLQELSLGPEQAEELVALLEEHTQPEKRTYQYRHFTNNCSTKVRDLIDRVTGGALSAQFKSRLAVRTYREWTRHYTGPFPLWAAAIDFALGPAADEPVSRFDEQYLPSTLADDLARATLKDPPRPLVRRTETFGPLGSAPFRDKDAWEIWYFIVAGAVFFAAALLPIALGDRTASRRIFGCALTAWGFVTGILGALLLLLQTTAHTDTHFNENHLLSPLTNLWLIVPGIGLLLKGRLTAHVGRATKIYLWASFGLITADLAWKFIDDAPQDNWRYLVAASICVAGMIAAFQRSGVRK